MVIVGVEDVVLVELRDVVSESDADFESDISGEVVEDDDNF